MSINHAGVMIDTVNWFRTAVPNPTTKQVHTQLGVHFEEVGEMIEELPAADHETDELLYRASQAIKALAKHLKATDQALGVAIINPSMLLDALCDQLVTAIGSAHVLNLPIIEGLDEVNRSNWSKFVDGKPVFDANMKIQKGPNYFKPDLSKFVSA